MGWTGYQKFLAVLLVVTGSINTIGVKWQDRLESEGRDGKMKHFHHPIFQASNMFLGELSCLLVFKILLCIYSRKKDGAEDEAGLTKGNRDFNPFLLFIPAMLDMGATCVMYVGLNLTYASSFQMLRGSTIIFVGVLSMIFLHRKLGLKEWSGIFLVIIGLALVGLADFFGSSNEEGYTKSGIITGDVMIVLGQILHSTQMVIEEKYVSGLDIPPLQAVGWEGVCGFTVLGLLQIPLYYVRANPPITLNEGDRVEDAIDAFVQMSNSWQVSLAFVGVLVSIAFFNFAGISVTKELSATTRVVLDSIRTMVIWAFSLAFFGQKFHWLQLLGFLLLMIGMCLYNDVTCDPITKMCRKEEAPQEAENTNAGDTRP